MASLNPSFEVTEHSNGGIFSSLSRNSDQTIDNINNNDENSTVTTGGYEILSE